MYIGRPHRARSGKQLAASIWANPFKLHDCADRTDCLSRFRSHLSASPALLRLLPDLAGKRLICHCASGVACHADVLIEHFNKFVQPNIVFEGLTLGIPFDVVEFVSAALKLQHPFEPHALPGPLEHCIRFRMTSSVKHVISSRNAAVHFWRGRVDLLEPREVVLHNAMHVDVAAVMAGKRVLAFSEMLASIQFPVHRRLTHLLSTGFPVTGAYPPSEVLPRSSRTASLDVADLWRTAKDTQNRISSRPGSSDDRELDREVYASTLAEAKRGWLKGPFSPTDLSSRLGCWVPSRRFGVRQGGKVRCIDDYAASGINSALSATETVEPDDLCAIAGNVRAHMDAFTASSSSRPTSSYFSSSVRHADHAEARLLARMWDLESAYRQLARSPSHSSFTVIAAWDPDDEIYKYFEQPPLGFGASASVLSFKWVASALKAVLIDIFSVALTNFYDDFTILEVEVLATNAREVVEQVFHLLGWRLKELPDLSSETSPLGAVLNLDHCRKGFATIRNKESRVKEIIQSIDDAGATAVVPSDLLPRLRGRLLFARSLSFGRCGGVALRALGSAIVTNDKRTISIQGELARALFSLRQHLLGARPREIRVAHRHPPVLFVDGAFETADDGSYIGSIGAVIYDPIDKACELFRLSVSSPHLAFLLGAGKTAIFQLEILPVVVSRLLWTDRLRDRALFTFVDNEAAKAALIAGYSAQPVAVRLLAVLTELDVKDGALTWFERVPTSSNPADAPSRLALPHLQPDWPVPVERQVKDLTADLLNGLRADAVADCTGTKEDPRVFSSGAI